MTETFGPRTILVVEDNPDDVLLTQRAFAKNGVSNEMKVVSDGAEALEYLLGTGRYAGRDACEQPCLILLDLNLPRIGGLEILKRLRAERKTRLIPVVVLTSSKEEQDIIESYTLGANSYIRKPVDFESFLQAVRQLGLCWLLLNEPPPAPSRHG